MKKKKIQIILTRIFACALVIILALGIIAPVVASATELKKPEQNTTNTEQSEQQGNNNELSEPFEDEKPEQTLSDGFEYKKNGDAWEIVKVTGNTNAAFIVDGLPTAGFDGFYLTFFVGNIETQEVIAVEVMNDYCFTKSISLADGYYVIFANEYSFSDSKGNVYAINGGQNTYFHIGQNFDDEKYPVKFTDANIGLLHLNLEKSPSGYTEIKHNQRVSVTSADLSFPDDAKIGAVNNNKNEENKTNNSSNNQNKTEDNNDKKEEPKKERRSIWAILKDSLSRSALLIVGIIGCFIGISVVKAKKKSSLEEQVESDKNDDGHIL